MSTRASRPNLAFMLLTMGIAAPLSAQGAPPRVQRLAGGITQVTNTGPTAWRDTTGWRLVLERTVQPPEGSPGMLERPREVHLLPDGRLLVVERQPATIKLYDTQGRYLHAIGREGDGPGEFRAPTAAVFHDTVIVHDGRLGRASLLTLDGKPVRDFLTNIHSDGPRISVDSHGRIRIQSTRVVGTTALKQWSYFDLKGNRIDSILPPQAVEPSVWKVASGGGLATYSIPWAPQTEYAFLGDGSFIYGSTGESRFLFSRNGRDTTRIALRTGVAPVPIPADVVDSVFRQYLANPQLASIAHRSDMPKVYPLWNAAAVDGSGNLWVAAGVARSKSLRYDVFDPAGRFLGVVPSIPEGVWGTSWSADHMAVLTVDADDLPVVRVYRIDRRGRM